MKLKKLFSSWRNGEGPKGTFGFDFTWGPKSRKPLRTLGNETSVLDCSFSETMRRQQQHKYSKVGRLKICNEKKNWSEIFFFYLNSKRSSKFVYLV